MSYELKISEQEKLDREICIRMVKRLLTSNYSLINVADLPVKAPIDLMFTFQDKSTGQILYAFIEVKSRNKNERQLKEYPWQELKVERLKRMREYQIQNLPNSCLFYAVILNNKDFYLYNLLNIDYTKVNVADWNIKKTQFNPDSPMETYKIFQLPFTLAKHADITETEKEKTEKTLF